MHKLCLSLHDMKRVMSNERTQPTSHRKVKRFHWIIHSWSLIPFPYSKNQIKLNSLHQCSSRLEYPSFFERINLCKPRIIRLLSCMLCRREPFAGVV